MIVVYKDIMTKQIKKKPVVLAIMDGWGHSEASRNNAVRLAHTPVIDQLDDSVPKAFLEASAGAVGLPDGQVGNSEVGHMTIGAGRIIEQDLVRINNAIREGTLQQNPMLDQLAKQLNPRHSQTHLLGMISDGGVHSHREHILALAEAITSKGISVKLHLFTDGRDTLPGTAAGHLAWLQTRLPEKAEIATISGRYYGMDRDHRWERTSLVINAIAHGKANYHFDNPACAITAAELRGETDEFILPNIIGDYNGMTDGDTIVTANFRADRVRQLLAGLLFDDTPLINVPPVAKLGRPISMTSYSERLDEASDLLFPPIALNNTLGDVVAAAGMSQFRLAETEKYPHVTFFLNGGAEDVHPGEERCLIPSPKVSTYDLKPDMSADAVLTALLASITGKQHDLIIVNFANPDMVGHTGVLEAAITAVEVVDHAIGKVISALDAVGGTMLLTADHGNCEVMWDDASNSPHTAHTTNPVPIYWIGAPKGGRLKNGGLSDLAPSLLSLLGISIPKEMTGSSLFITE